MLREDNGILRALVECNFTVSDKFARSLDSCIGPHARVSLRTYSQGA